ncbi:hypothetical protein KIN20_009043 [Parelaphostrongylus tenuis]|uniref:Uncharacterized protein n=1 Tax=Parelaphostrongylus tenuis TaxID=148309 RepID=A0AAD5QN29_PARTN|nr:hypothetical protein KIN20_009043 [Parelaphostrongylus tenuis]
MPLCMSDADADELRTPIAKIIQLVIEQQAREAAEKRCMELEQNDLARDGKSSDECSLDSSALLSPAEEAVTEVKEQSQLSKEAEAPGQKQKNEVCYCPATCVPSGASEPYFGSRHSLVKTLTQFVFLTLSLYDLKLLLNA